MNCICCNDPNASPRLYAGIQQPLCSRCHYDIRHIKEKLGYLLSDLGENKATTIAGVRACYWGEDGAALSEASNLQMAELKERHKTPDDKHAFVTTAWPTLKKFVIFIDTFVQDPKGRYLALTFLFPKEMVKEVTPSTHPHAAVLGSLIVYMSMIFKFDPLDPYRIAFAQREET